MQTPRRGRIIGIATQIGIAPYQVVQEQERPAAARAGVSRLPLRWPKAVRHLSARRARDTAAACPCKIGSSVTTPSIPGSMGQEADHAPNRAHPSSSSNRSAWSRAASGSSDSRCRTSGSSCHCYAVNVRAAPRMHGRLEYDAVGYLQPCAWHRSGLRRGREPRRVGRIAAQLAPRRRPHHDGGAPGASQGEAPGGSKRYAPWARRGQRRRPPGRADRRRQAAQDGPAGFRR